MYFDISSIVECSKPIGLDNSLLMFLDLYYLQYCNIDSQMPFLSPINYLNAFLGELFVTLYIVRNVDGGCTFETSIQ